MRQNVPLTGHQRTFSADDAIVTKTDLKGHISYVNRVFLNIAQLGQMNEATAAIAAAMEQQSSATAEIARNVEQASAGASDVAGNITTVRQQTGETGRAAAELVKSVDALKRQASELSQEMGQFLGELRQVA